MSKEKTYAQLALEEQQKRKKLRDVQKEDAAIKQDIQTFLKDRKKS